MTIQGYRPVPVEAAAQISRVYRKDIVVVISFDHEFQRVHATTFGISAEDKLYAADLGDELAKTTGCAMEQKRTYEDFRLDAAKLKEENDRLKREICKLAAAKVTIEEAQP